MALIRAAAAASDNREYDVRVGLEWAGPQPLVILTRDNFGQVFDAVSTPLHRFTPVEVSIDASESDLDYYWHVHDLALDCVNQGGISNTQMIKPPARDGDT